MNFHVKISNFQSWFFSQFKCGIQVFFMRFHYFSCKISNFQSSFFSKFRCEIQVFFMRFHMARYSRHSIDDRTNWLWWLGKFFRYCGEDRLDWIPRLIRSNSMIDLIKFDDRRWLIRSNLVIDLTDCEDSIDWIHDQFLGIRPNTLYRLSHARSIDFKPEMNIIECF